jgi:hypothetical protein
MNDSEQCIATKADGQQCDYAAKYADEKCGIHTDETDTGPGRPTKFTDERARLAIAAARDEGKSKAGCERAAGIGNDTLSGWLETDPTFTDENGDERNFSEAFVQARARGESMYIEDGRDLKGDTSFAKFMLSSSYGYEKTEKRKQEHSGDVSGVFDVTIGGDVDE